MSGTGWVPLQSQYPDPWGELQKYNTANKTAADTEFVKAQTVTEREQPAFVRANTAAAQIKADLDRLSLRGRSLTANALEEQMRNSQNQNDSGYTGDGSGGGGANRPFTPAGRSALDGVQTEPGDETQEQPSKVAEPDGESAPNVLQRLRAANAPPAAPEQGGEPTTSPEAPATSPAPTGQAQASPNALAPYQLAGEMQPPPVNPPANQPAATGAAALQHPAVVATATQPPAQGTVTAPQQPNALSQQQQALRAAYENGTSPGGAVYPGIGPIPKLDYLRIVGAAYQGQDVAPMLKNVAEHRTQRLYQLAQSANDDSSWNTNVQIAWREGLMTNGARDHMMGHFPNKDQWIQTLISPEAASTQGASLAGAGLQRNPTSGKIEPSLPALSVKEPIEAETQEIGPDGKPTGNWQKVKIPRDAWQSWTHAGQPVTGDTVPVRTTQTVKGSDGNPYQTTTTQDVPASLVKPASQGGAGGGASGSFDRYAAQTRQAEGSVGDDNVKNKAGSSATGRYQWLDQTWLDTVKKNAPDVAQGKTDAQILALRGSDLEEPMMKAFTADNAAALKAQGSPVNATTLRLAHWFGADGVKKMFGADANTPIENVASPDVVRQNGLAGKTVGQVAQQVRQQFGTKPVDVGGNTRYAGPGVPSGGAPDQSGTVTAPAPGPGPAAVPGLPPGTMVTGAPTPTEQMKGPLKTTEQAVTGDRSIVADAQTSAMKAQSAMPTILDLRQRVASVPASAMGPGAEERLTMDAVLKTYGPQWAGDFAKWVTNNKIDPANTAQLQDMRKQFFQLVTAAEGAQPGSRFGAQLTGFYSHAMPSLSMDKDAVKEMLNVVLVGNQMARDYANAAAAHFNANNDAYKQSGAPRDYHPMTEFDEAYSKSDSKWSPATYEGASKLLNGHDHGDWASGLSIEQQQQAIRIATSADRGAHFTRKQLGLPDKAA